MLLAIQGFNCEASQKTLMFSAWKPSGFEATDCNVKKRSLDLEPEPCKGKRKLLSPAARGRSTSVVYKDIQDGVHTPIPSFLYVFAVFVLDLDRSPKCWWSPFCSDIWHMGIPKLKPLKHFGIDITSKIISKVHTLTTRSHAPKIGRICFFQAMGGGWFVAMDSIRVFWSSRNLDSTRPKAWHGAQLKDDFSDVTRKQNGNVGRFFILCFTFVVLGMSCAMMILNQGLFIYSLFPPFDMSLGWSPNVPLRLTTHQVINAISFMWYWDSDKECAITNLLVHSTEHPWIRAWDRFAETLWKPLNTNHGTGRDGPMNQSFGLEIEKISNSGRNRHGFRFNPLAFHWHQVDAQSTMDSPVCWIDTSWTNIHDWQLHYTFLF